MFVIGSFVGFATIMPPRSLIASKDADARTYFSFIAQEVQEVYPDLVYEDRNVFLSINYAELIPVLVDVIKELKNRN
jgi:hypothetical protein